MSLLQIEGMCEGLDLPSVKLCLYTVQLPIQVVYLYGLYGVSVSPWLVQRTWNALCLAPC